MASQLEPSSRVRKTRFPVAYSVPGSCGEKTMGKVHAKRYRRSLAPQP